MDEVVKEISWEAPEHRHFEKSSDWFWILGIVALSGAIAAFFLDNFLFAMVILIGAGTMALVANRKPRMVSFAVSTRGVRIDKQNHPFASLDSYHIDETTDAEPQLLLKSKRLHLQMIVIPVPEEYVDDIEDLIGSRLPEEELEEPFFDKVLEFFGF